MQLLLLAVLVQQQAVLGWGEDVVCCGCGRLYMLQVCTGMNARTYAYAGMRADRRGRTHTHTHTHTHSLSLVHAQAQYMHRHNHTRVRASVRLPWDDAAEIA